jgi:hypothetical protein
MFFFRLFTFCSARVSALVIVLSDCPYEEIGKWDICPILKENRSLVRVSLEHLLYKKTGTLLGVSRGPVCKVMSAYTNHGKTTSAKRNSERKSTLTETYRRLYIQPYRHRRWGGANFQPVLYGYATFSLTFWEEKALQIFENK